MTNNFIGHINNINGCEPVVIINAMTHYVGVCATCSLYKWTITKVSAPTEFGHRFLCIMCRTREYSTDDPGCTSAESGGETDSDNEDD